MWRFFHPKFEHQSNTESCSNSGSSQIIVTLSDPNQDHKLPYICGVCILISFSALGSQVDGHIFTGGQNLPTTISDVTHLWIIQYPSPQSSTNSDSLTSNPNSCTSRNLSRRYKVQSSSATTTYKKETFFTKKTRVAKRLVSNHDDII